jgi:hypothetical protein
VGEVAIALAGTNPKNNRAKHLASHQWKPGQTGNPTGRPKGSTIRELREVARANFELAAERLKGLIQSQDEGIALQAVQFAYLYTLGKPMEGHDILHLESKQARHQELVAEPEPQHALPSPAPEPVSPPVPEPLPQAVDAVPLAPSLTDAAPTEALGDVRVPEAPSGLRCMYRGKDGQCAEHAPDGSQWCAPHKAKLFEAIK